MKLALICIACILFGMTWDVNWDRPYYECPGYFTVEQRLIGVEFEYIWNDFGYRRREWNVCRKSRPRYNRTESHPG